MKIAICDDDALFIKKLKMKLEKCLEIEEIKTYSNYMFLLDEIQGRYSPDLVFMDMDWEQVSKDANRQFNVKENGMLLAEEFYKYSPRTKVLFVTAYVDYFAERMFLHKANITGFLCKPVDDQLLAIYLKRVRKQLEEEQEQYMTLQSPKGKIYIAYRDLVYIESENHTVHFHLCGETISRGGKISDLEEMLPSYFVRIHRGFIVNLNYVEEIQRHTAAFRRFVHTVPFADTIPVGRSYYEEVRKKLALWNSR